MSNKERISDIRRLLAQIESNPAWQNDKYDHKDGFIANTLGSCISDLIELADNLNAIEIGANLCTYCGVNNLQPGFSICADCDPEA